MDQSIDGGCLEVDLLLEPPRDEAAPLQHVVGSEHQEVGPVRGVRQGRPQVRGQGGGDDQVILPPRVAARCPQLARSGAGPQVVADHLLGVGVLNDHLLVPISRVSVEDDWASTEGGVSTPEPARIM